MSSRGVATRVALVETAERLFAEQGIESVSLRDISSAAGQRNHSAAQYHFGDRAGLVAAVFEHRMRVVNERRHARLAELAAEDRTDDAIALVEAVVHPLAEVVAETDGWYGRFLVRARWDAFALSVLSDLDVMSSYRQALELLSSALDDLPADTRHARLDQMATLFIGTIAGWEWRRHHGERTRSLEAMCADLVATSHAVLFAPTTVIAH
jgi:AcrR family transcriptional regulator